MTSPEPRRGPFKLPIPPPLGPVPMRFVQIVVGAGPSDAIARHKGFAWSAVIIGSESPTPCRHFRVSAEDCAQGVDSYAVTHVRASDMANDTRMTVRLDPATRRKVERLAARDGISLNEALNRLLQHAPDQASASVRRRRYRLRPRKVGFGFEVAHARQLAAQMSDDRMLSKLKASLKR